jgi:hypothetical protein
MDSKVLDFNKALEDKQLLTIWHDCHRCDTARCIPQHIGKEKDILEKPCPKCNQIVAIW